MQNHDENIILSHVPNALSNGKLPRIAQYLFIHIYIYTYIYFIYRFDMVLISFGITFPRRAFAKNATEILTNISSFIYKTHAIEVNLYHLL